MSRWSNADIAERDKMRGVIENLRYEFQALRKSIDGAGEKVGVVDSLNLEISNLRGKIEVLEPIIATLLENKLSEKLKSKLPGVRRITDSEPYRSR